MADDVSNLCAGGTQHATSKKINEEKNRSFKDKLWRQTSKLQGSLVLSFLSLGSTAAQEMNYHRVCLTEFHNRYRALVTVEAKEQPFDSYKTELHFYKIVIMYSVRDDLESMYFVSLSSKISALNLCLKTVLTALHMLHDLHRD